MKRRVVFLTAGFGEGHNAAASALAEAASERFGADAVRVVDLFAVARPRTNALARRAYRSLINRTPRLWSSTYHWLDRSPRAPRLLAFLRPEVRALAELIAEESPDVLCSTYPMYGFMIAALRRTNACTLPPHFTVVTDSISINSLWWRADCAGWFVPNPDSAEVLRRAGVDDERIHVLGFPVAPFFADQQGRLSPPELSGGADPRVLCVIHSARRGAADIARRLLAEPDWDVTCTVGHDEPLRSELMRLADYRTRSTPILGWTKEMPRLLMTHHVVITKAGGATTQEALAAHCPMMVNEIVPGQEEGNYELLRRHGIGALTPDPETVVRELRRAFADGAGVWRAWRAATQRLAQPNAARAIVASILPETPAAGTLAPPQPAELHG